MDKTIVFSILLIFLGLGYTVYDESVKHQKNVQLTQDMAKIEQNLIRIKQLEQEQRAAKIYLEKRRIQQNYYHDLDCILRDDTCANE